MSWSLQIRNGDLALGGAQFGQVTGQTKLVQDLRCALLESRGHDDMHPLFGSMIDGGYDEFGVYHESLISSTNWQRAALQIESEIRRICLDHQRRQLERARQDRNQYGESTLSPAELLLQVADIDMVQAQDRLLVTVHIVTGNNNTVAINIPVDATGVLG